jgi:hypothetical protein
MSPLSFFDLGPGPAIDLDESFQWRKTAFGAAFLSARLSNGLMGAQGGCTLWLSLKTKGLIGSIGGTLSRGGTEANVDFQLDQARFHFDGLA